MLLAAWRLVPNLYQYNFRVFQFHILKYFYVTSSHRGDDGSPSALVLDFGEDVILMREVTKQLLITNESAVPADFTIKAEFFTCHVSMAYSTLEQR